MIGIIVPNLGDTQTAHSILSAMMTPDELNAILERITQHQQTEQDLEMLRRSLAGDRQVATQLGKYNVNIGEGKEIHIGDRIYYSWNDEALSTLVCMIQFGDVDEAYLLVTKLNNARLQGEEGNRKTGSFYSYNIWLEDVSLENAQHSTGNNRHIQQYTIIGKWNSRVYQEINVFGVRVDQPWGVKKKPYGDFTAKLEMLNGRVTQIKVEVARYNDSANNYAADKAEKLIQSKIKEVLRFF